MIFDGLVKTRESVVLNLALNFFEDDFRRP